MITLTFAKCVESWESGGYIRDFVRRLRQASADAGLNLSYMWVMELQKRLAFHYHIVAVGLPFIPVQVLRSWWPYGWAWISKGRGSPGGAFSYLLKYVVKLCKPGEWSVDGQCLVSACGVRRFATSRDLSGGGVDAPPPWVLDVARSQGWESQSVTWGYDGPDKGLGWVRCGQACIWVCGPLDCCWQLAGSFGLEGEDDA